MKNLKITKAVICLVGLICYMFPFFKLTFGAFDFGGIMGGIGSSSMNISISGIQTFATMQSTAGVLKYTEINVTVVWWVIYLVMAWNAIPFALMAAMGIRNLIHQDKNTRVLTIIGGAINSVLIGGVLIYFTAKPGEISLNQISDIKISFTGAWGLWLLLIVNIAMFVLGLYQNPETSQVSYRVPQKVSGGSGVLIGMNGAYSNSRIPIEERTELTLGRDSIACNLIVNGAKISRKHCGVKYDPNMQVYRVIDYSTNGTYAGDGTRLLSNQYTQLKKGSIIYLGDQSNMFQLE